MSDGYGNWGIARIPEGEYAGGQAPHIPAHRSQGDEEEEEQRRKVRDWMRQGVVKYWRPARPSRYTVTPLAESLHQKQRSHGLIRDVFALAAETFELTYGYQAEWQRRNIYQLGRRLQVSVRIVRSLDRQAGNKPRTYVDMFGAPEKRDGVYIQPCEWCGRQFTSKRSDALFCPGGKCRQAHYRGGTRLADKVLSNKTLHLKVEADKTLLENIREIALYSRHPRCEILNRAADALELVDADMAALAAELY